MKVFTALVALLVSLSTGFVAGVIYQLHEDATSSDRIAQQIQNQTEGLIKALGN